MIKHKITYLTTNKYKVEEANRHLEKRYGIALNIVNPDFEILEIQADTCAKVAAFSAKYAANTINKPALKSDTGLYIDHLGGLPGPYNSFFDKQIGVDKFLEMMKNVKKRSARLEHCFAYCEPGSEPAVFSGGSRGYIAKEAKGDRGRWHDKFFIPEGEEKTLSELRAWDEMYEAKFWGSAIDDFAKWYLSYGS